MREELTERLIIGASICVFGAIVHVADHFSKTSPKRMGLTDMGALAITSLFSGFVFGLIAMMLSENHLHWYLAIATGSFLGLPGLNRVTDSAVTILTMVIKK